MDPPISAHVWFVRFLLLAIGSITMAWPARPLPFSFLWDYIFSSGGVRGLPCFLFVFFLKLFLFSFATFFMKKNLQNFVYTYRGFGKCTKKIRKKKRKNLQDIKLAQTNVKISPCQKLTTCNRSTILCKKIGEYNWKARNTSPTISQMCAPKSEHDQIWAWWASDILYRNNLLKIIWWCKCSNIKF